MSPPRLISWGLIWAGGLLLLTVSCSCGRCFHRRTGTDGCEGTAELGKQVFISSRTLQISVPAFFGLGSSTWNILYHLGGNGPWIKKVDGVVDGGVDVPEGCKVEQVHMVWPRSFEAD